MSGWWQHTGGAAVATEDIEHIPRYGGTIRFVDGTNGSDANDGLSPTKAMATITAAIAASGPGDAVNVRYGNYDEAGLNLNQTAMELWLEAGTILRDSAGGTVLTVSAFGCKVVGSGNVRLDPTGGATGVLVSGNFCWLDNLRVSCNDAGALGYDLTGAGTELHDCRCASPTVAAFKVQGDKSQLSDCCTGGTTGAGTIGFWITNSCDKARLRGCGSQGHSTAGFQVDAGCTNGVVSNSHSGGGDGPRIDDGSLFHWPFFESVSAREQHYELYPISDGEGTAGDPISVSSDAEDETNGPATTKDYWGEPRVLLAPAVFTELWSLFGLSLFADTAGKIFQIQLLRVNYGQRSAKNGGNAWDEGETALTVADGSVFQAGDLVWVYSDYVTDGEIQRVDSVAGNVVTVEREASQFGAPNTGLRWDHTTNDPGTEVMYLVYRESNYGMHPTFTHASFASAKDFGRRIFSDLREFKSNDGLLARVANQTDGFNGSAIDMAFIYREGGN